MLPVNLKWSIKVRGPDFFKQIVQRYSIITKSDRFPSLILLKLLENAGGKTKLTNVNKNNITKILNTSIRQYLNLYVTIQSRENVIVPDLYVDNALSYGRHVPEQQVNIRTDLAKDTKHIVIPGLISHLQRIDDQGSGYGFLPASAKTLATTGLVRTLPERMPYHRERSKGTVIPSNNPYPESDIRIIRHTPQPTIARTLQPAIAGTSQEKTQYQNSAGPETASLSKKYPDKGDNFVFAGIDETQASGIQIEKTGNFSELEHLTMPDIPLFDEYTSPGTADIPGVGVSENTKARDIILHPRTHTEEKIPKMDAIMTHIQKRNKLVYEKHEDFGKRTTDRYLVTGKTNIANKLISNTHIARSRMTNMESEAGEVMEIPQEISQQNLSQNIPQNIPNKIPKLLFDQDGIFLQHASHAQTGMSTPLNFSSNDIVRGSSDLVLRKPAVHSAEKGLENTGKPDITKTERTRINAEKKDIIGTNIQARNSIDDIANTATIATIADKVYKVLETRISIEKERRGL